MESHRQDGRQNMPDHVAAGSMFENAHNINIHGGTYIATGRDVVYNIVNNYAPQPQLTLDELLRGMPDNNYSAFLQDTYEKRTPETGLTFLRLGEIQGWERSSGGIVCATGIPGAGKTYQTALLIHRFQQLAQQDPSILITFAFIHRSDSVTVVDILAACTRQLAEKSPMALDLLVQLLARHNQTKTRPSASDYLDLFKAILGQGFRVFCFIDALDEANPDVRYAIVKAFLSIGANTFFTSRPSSALQLQLESSQRDVVSLSIAAEDDDLRKLMTEKLAQTPEFGLLMNLHNLNEDIADVVIQKSGGMFLHATLLIEAIRHCVDIKSLRETLKKCPNVLDEMYGETWKRIQQQPQNRPELAKRICLWLVYAAHPMTIKELQHVLALSPDDLEFDHDRVIPEGTVISVCGGLVTTEAKSQIVRLVHRTANDALKPYILRYNAQPHGLIARACIARLISHHFPQSHLTSSQRIADALHDDIFLAYSYEYVGFHVRECGKTHPHSLDFVLPFLRQCKTYPYRQDGTLSRLSYDTYQVIFSFQSLHVAALLGTQSAFSKLIEEDKCDVNAPAMAQRGAGPTPLMIASWQGYEEFVKYLLELPGTRIDATIEDGSNALIMASIRGHERVVEHILHYIKTHEGWRRGALALLRSPAAQVNVTDTMGWTPLMHASRYGRQGVVDRLLQFPGIQGNVQGERGSTALQMASTFGHDGVVALLLKPHSTLAVPIDVNLSNETGYSPLALAATHGHIGILNKLLAHPDVEVNKETRKGLTALNSACFWGHQEVIKCLLQCPTVDVNKANKKGWTPLITAAFYGHQSVVQLLLGHPGIQIDSKNEGGWDAVGAAAESRHEGIEAMLKGFTNG